MLNLATSFVRAEKDTLSGIRKASGSTPSIPGLQAQSLTELLPLYDYSPQTNRRPNPTPTPCEADRETWGTHHALLPFLFSL